MLCAFDFELYRMQLMKNGCNKLKYLALKLYKCKYQRANNCVLAILNIARIIEIFFLNLFF